MTSTEIETEETTSEESRQLPKGWRWARLGEACEERTGTRDPHCEPNHPFWYVDISSVNNLQKQIDSAKHLLGQDAPSRARQIIRAKDVIVATTRPNLNAVALIPDSLDNQICSTGFCVLRPTADIDPDFLFAYVQSSEFVHRLSDLVKGALYPAVSDRQVRGQPIPLPPLAEQKRITVILADQMAAVGRAQAAAEVQLEAAIEMPAAYLRKVFATAEAQKWPKARLGDICEIMGGNTLPELAEGKNAEKIYCLKVSDLNGPYSDGRLLNGGAQYTNSSHAGSRVLRAGSVVFPKRGGAIATNKKRILSCNAVLDPNLMGIQIKEAGKILPMYLLLWFESWDLASLQSGNTIPQINQQDLSPLWVQAPSLSEQQRIVDDNSQQMKEANNIRRACSEQIESINKLPSVLLRQAFAGEL